MKNIRYNPIRQRLIRHWRVVCFIFGLALALGVGARDPGYLAVIGPCPLRFAPPPMVPTNHFVLPPPAPAAEPEPEPAAHVSPAKTNAAPKPAAGRFPDSGALSTNQSTEVTATATAAGSDPAQAEPVISPQMLLQFFNRTSGTNGGGTSVSAPMEFNPPHTQPPAQSSATYVSP